MVDSIIKSRTKLRKIEYTRTPQNYQETLTEKEVILTEPLLARSIQGTSQVNRFSNKQRINFKIAEYFVTIMSTICKPEK